VYRLAYIGDVVAFKMVRRLEKRVGGPAYWRIGVRGSKAAFRHRYNDHEVSTELMMLCKRRHADTPIRFPSRAARPKKDGKTGQGKSLSSDSTRARSQRQQKEASKRVAPDARERIPTGAGGAPRHSGKGSAEHCGARFLLLRFRDAGGPFCTKVHSQLRKYQPLLLEP
jgi:hypothetical protein